MESTGLRYVVAECLEDFLLAGPSSGEAFSGVTGQLSSRCRTRAEEAGIPGELRHPHVLSHTRAIKLLRAGGMPVTAVQQLLGHADVTTTAVYLRLSGMEIRRIMEDRGLL